MPSITTYNKRFGIKLMIILPLIIVLLLILSTQLKEISNVFSQLAAVVWILLLVNSIFVSVGGFSLGRDFSQEVRKQQNLGFPIKSMSGFSETERSIRTVFSSSLFITLMVLLSLIMYLSVLVLGDNIDRLIKDTLGSGLETLQQTLKLTIQITAVGLIFIAIGISMLLTLPEKPALVPGSLMTYFKPSNLPNSLDNFLTDGVVAFLDPVTKLRWDEFSESIMKGLSSSYLPDLSQNDRLASAREKILLLSYLSVSIPVTMTPEVVRREFREMFSSESALDVVMKGEGSGVSWEVLTRIITDVKRLAPEIFVVIDRIMVELKDNLASFKENDLWMTVASPTTIMGKKPIRFMVFMVNKSKEFASKRRPVIVRLTADELGALPDNFPIHLDPSAGFEIKGDKLDTIAATGEDVVGLTSRILQLGDAVWFQVSRNRFGTHIFNVRVEEDGRATVFGSSFRVTLARDLAFYAQTYGGKLSALGGLALPLLAGAISFLPR